MLDGFFGVAKEASAGASPCVPVSPLILQVFPTRMGGTSTRQGMRSSLRSLPHTHGGALKCLSEEENSPHKWGTGAFSPCLFSMLGDSLHRWSPLTGSPEPKASGCLPYTHVGNHITAFHQEYCERSSPHACRRPDAGGRTGGRKERRNIAFPTLVGETSFGSQYAHSYDFFPTRMGKPHAHDPSLTCHVVFPTCYGGVPSSPGDARTGSWSSLHVRGSSPSRPVPHAPDATFRKAGSLSVCTACAPMLRAGMNAFHAGRSFPARFLLCSLQETAMRNSVGAAGCRFAKEYT